MQKFLISLFLFYTSPMAANADSIKLFIAIKIDMQMGVGQDRIRKNNPERVTQYMAGKGFLTSRDCELYMLEQTGSNVVEQYRDELVWNNYASDNKTIVTQWRCLQVFVLDSYLG